MGLTFCKVLKHYKALEKELFYFHYKGWEQSIYNCLQPKMQFSSHTDRLANKWKKLVKEKSFLAKEREK